VSTVALVLYSIFILRTGFVIKGQTYFTLIDDAMVSMRYAQHLAQGYSLVWNIGEQPVEGFTNPAWMLFMAFLHLSPLPASKISLAVLLAEALILLANIVVVYRICETLQPKSKYAPLLAAALSAFYFPLTFWALRGMETGPLTLLVNLAALLAFKLSLDSAQYRVTLLSLVLALALMTRMDALLQISIILMYLISRNKPNWRVVGLPLLAVLLTLIVILWFQRAYFGDFLPNTYYQKLAGTSAWERIKNGILAFNQHATRDTLMPVLFCLAGLVLYKDLRSREAALLAGLFIVQCAYSVWVGGDYAEVEVDAANRFITQGMSALFILFSLVAERLISDLVAVRRPRVQSGPEARSAIAVAVALATLLVICGTPWMNWAIDNAPLLKADIRRVKVGLLIAANTSPNVTIAVHAAGQIPYYSQRRTIDLLGLNDPVVAKAPPSGPFYPGHDKWNYEYSILQLKPDLIADNWDKLADFMRDKSDYQKLENGIYVRNDSTLLDVIGLSKPIR
jgi:hypothetical protein